MDLNEGKCHNDCQCVNVVSNTSKSINQCLQFRQNSNQSIQIILENQSHYKCILCETFCLFMEANHNNEAGGQDIEISWCYASENATYYEETMIETTTRIKSGSFLF